MLLNKILILFLYLYNALLSVLSRLNKPRSLTKDKKITVLITGTFYSDNWLLSHLKPLASAHEVDTVIMVADSSVPVVDKVRAVYPPVWLRKLFGSVGARSILFFWLGLRERPDVVAGFHLLLNGLIAIILAKVIRAYSVYICGGGPREVSGGGYTTENKIFGRLNKPDLHIEGLLLKAASKSDIIIVRGKRAAEYFKEKGIKVKIEVMPAGIDGEIFCPSARNKIYDLIIVGRLSEVKRVDLFLSVVSLLRKRIGSISAVVVGDGPDFNKLKKMCIELDIDDVVSFVGQQHNVEEWLMQSKVFVLTSSSEGLSQAMIQAMLCGLPVVVANVGDLDELVEPGINGELIGVHDPELFSEAISSILIDDSKLASYGEASRKSALKCDINAVSTSWDRIFLSLDQKA